MKTITIKISDTEADALLECAHGHDDPTNRARRNDVCDRIVRAYITSDVPIRPTKSRRPS